MVAKMSKKSSEHAVTRRGTKKLRVFRDQRKSSFDIFTTILPSENGRQQVTSLPPPSCLHTVQIAITTLLPHVITLLKTSYPVLC